MMTEQNQPWGPFLECPNNFLGPESYSISARFTLKIQILLAFKAAGSFYVTWHTTPNF